MLELKARVDSFVFVRNKLRDLKAQYVGTFRQIDTYFNVPKGRLKLREVEGSERAKLIYYEREDIPGLKRSNVLILEIQESEPSKAFFERVLGKKIVVDKKREIYMHKGTQIHLDIIKDLGTFIEFERKTKDFIKDRKLLKELMKNLKIKDKDLLKGSYSDILLAPTLEFEKR